MSAQNTLKRKISQIIGCVALSTFLLAPAFSAKKPPPPTAPASDVICDGCVGTTDIEDGAVTLDKLGSDVANAIAPIYKPAMLFDANGAIVGQFLTQPGTYYAVLISSTGYIFAVNAWLGNVSRSKLFYDNRSCSGMPYLVRGRSLDLLPPSVGDDGGDEVVSGHVFSSSNTELNSELYYIPKGAAMIPQQTPYYLNDNSSCIFFGLTAAFEAVPNDPTETGVEFSSFPAPLTLGLP